MIIWYQPVTVKLYLSALSVCSLNSRQYLQQMSACWWSQLCEKMVVSYLRHWPSKTNGIWSHFRKGGNSGQGEAEQKNVKNPCVRLWRNRNVHTIVVAVFVFIVVAIACYCCTAVIVVAVCVVVSCCSCCFLLHLYSCWCYCCCCWCCCFLLLQLLFLVAVVVAADVIVVAVVIVAYCCCFLLLQLLLLLMLLLLIVVVSCCSCCFLLQLLLLLMLLLLLLSLLLIVVVSCCSCYCCLLLLLLLLTAQRCVVGVRRDQYHDSQHPIYSQWIQTILAATGLHWPHFRVLSRSSASAFPSSTGHLSHLDSIVSATSWISVPMWPVFFNLGDILAEFSVWYAPKSSIAVQLITIVTSFW